MKYAFIRAHREEFGVWAMCRVLRVHFSRWTCHGLMPLL
jgi:putative transposase